MNICVVVLNWNGREHLPELLDSLIAAREQYESDYQAKCRLVVLDNPGPTDDISWIRSNYPLIDCIKAPRNDFLFSYNWLMPCLVEDYVVLLNNDLRVDRFFLGYLIQPFLISSRVFATSACSRSWDGGHVNGSAFRLGGAHGWYWWQMTDSSEVTDTLFAVGGYMAVDRQKFLVLGGFDSLFYPAYGEDVDLSLRAWEHGWRVLYVPQSIVYHKESASWQIGGRRDFLFRLSHILLLERYFSAFGCRLGRSLRLLRQSLQPSISYSVLRSWIFAWYRLAKYRGRRFIPFCFPSL